MADRSVADFTPAEVTASQANSAAVTAAGYGNTAIPTGSYATPQGMIKEGTPGYTMQSWGGLTKDPVADVAKPGAQVITPKLDAAGIIASTPNYVGDVAKPTVAARTITDNETVASQLNKLLSADNPYIQNARLHGEETANSRGLINSSIAAGTSQRAAIDAALPIATSDAGTYATAGLSAQNANQDITKQGYQSLIDSALKKQDFTTSSALNDQNIQANKDLKTQGDQTTVNTKVMDINAAVADRATVIDANKDAAAIVASATVTADKLKMNATDKTDYVSRRTTLQQEADVSFRNIDSIADTVMSADKKALAKANIQDTLDANVWALGVTYSGAASASMGAWTVDVAPTGYNRATNGLVATEQARQKGPVTDTADVLHKFKGADGKYYLTSNAATAAKPTTAPDSVHNSQGPDRLWYSPEAYAQMFPAQQETSG